MIRSNQVSIPLFFDFLEAKPLYYKEIDHRRVHQAYAKLRKEINHPKTVHIVGTNGKGSTGRMIAYLAHRGGLQVGHFSSPHILKFNERIWINGNNCSDEILEWGHRRLYTILGKEQSESLSYFEYTTLLALLMFEKLDLIVLEAGLGGEYDATNVCDKALSVITPVGIDHQAFLGDVIEEIAATKIRSIQKVALLAPQPYTEVVKVSKRIAEEKGAEVYFSVERLAFSAEGGPSGTSNLFEAAHSLALPRTSSRFLEEIAAEKGWPVFLRENAVVALQALDILDISYRIDDLKELDLFGRFYPLTENIRIDVGHNPLAARAIASALEDSVVLIYNSLDDKDYEEVLRLLKPKVKRVEIISIDSQRAVTVEKVENALESVGLDYYYYDGTIDPQERYLVFGSFYTVEAFLKTQPGLLSGSIS